MTRLTKDDERTIAAIEETLRVIMGKLDDSRHICDCCHMVRFNNYREKNLSAQVGGTINKLSKLRQEVSRLIDDSLI